ncbi:hypothetical protein [Desulfosporosinus sp. FKB]|nr:hypothetical protein [Desulfosporosinus sp. FKB]
MPDCVFCTLAEEDILARNELARAFFDKFPAMQYLVDRSIGN